MLFTCSTVRRLGLPDCLLTVFLQIEIEIVSLKLRRSWGPELLQDDSDKEIVSYRLIAQESNFSYPPRTVRWVFLYVYISSLIQNGCLCPTAFAQTRISGSSAKDCSEYLTSLYFEEFPVTGTGKKSSEQAHRVRVRACWELGAIWSVEDTLKLVGSSERPHILRGTGRACVQRGSTPLCRLRYFLWRPVSDVSHP